MGKENFNEVQSQPKNMPLSSGIQVVGERNEMHEEFRWGTRNTKLAAAMLVLGFQLSKPQPFTVLIAARQETVTIWFHPDIENKELPPRYIREDGRHILQAREVEALWLENEEKAMDIPCVLWMRKGLEARDFLIREANKIPTSGQLLSKGMLATSSIREAATAFSCGAQYHGWRDKRWHFHRKAERIIAESQLQESKLRPRWALLGILQQGLLMDVIRGRKAEATAAEVIGARGTAYLPAMMPAPFKEAYLQQIDGV